MADLVCMGGIAFCALVLLCSERVMEAYTSMTAGPKGDRLFTRRETM